MNNPEPFQHGSLFSGIGGFDLAAKWMGWENMFHCEIEKFPRRILNYYWPNAISYEDITKTDFSIWRGRINILSGGFPCQPYSVAGKRKGKEDDRHLWPEMLRAIREIQPTWVVGENVYGLVNWDGGLVFEEVCADLENEGYEVQPIILPAASVGAPHRRDRIWFIAHSKHNRNSKRPQEIQRKSKGEGLEQQYGIHKPIESNSVRKSFSDSEHNGLHGSKGGRSDGKTGSRSKEGKVCTEQSKGVCESQKLGTLSEIDKWDDANSISQRRCCRNNKRENAEHVNARSEAFRFRGGFGRWPTVAPLCFRNDGISSLLDGITFPKFRNESIKGAGNAIVPQVVYEIFKVIQTIEKQISKEE